MSDLQCAATVLLFSDQLPPDRLTELARSVADQRVALVYAAPLPPAEAAGDLVAGLLKVGRRSEPALLDGDLGPVADLHRGETVVVLAQSDQELVRLELDDSYRGRLP